MKPEITARSTFLVEVYENVSTVRPNFEDLPHSDQQLTLKKLRPTYREHTHNVASNDFVEYLVDVIDPNQTSVTNQDPADFALGTDDTSPSPSDSSLQNQVGTITIASETDNGATLTMTGTIGESQLNGNTLREIGITNANNFFFNRALIGPIAKTNDETVTINAELTFTPQ